MFSRSDDEQLGLVLGVVAGIAALVIALVLGAALSRTGARNTPPAEPAPAPVAEPAAPPALPMPAAAPPPAAALSAQAAADAASITVEYGVVKFYFSSGDAELAAGARQALVDVVKAARGGKTVVVSGFHDARGDAARNAALAQRRAMAVRDALKEAGVADRQIRLDKPAQSAGSGSDAEARRVEITLQ